MQGHSPGGVSLWEEEEVLLLKWEERRWRLEIQPVEEERKDNRKTLKTQDQGTLKTLR